MQATFPPCTSASVLLMGAHNNSDSARRSVTLTRPSDTRVFGGCLGQMKCSKDPRTSRMSWLSTSILTHVVMHRAEMSSAEKVKWLSPQSLDKAKPKVLTIFSLRASQGFHSSFLICCDFL